MRLFVLSYAIKYDLRRVWVVGGSDLDHNVPFPIRDSCILSQIGPNVPRRGRSLPLKTDGIDKCCRRVLNITIQVLIFSPEPQRIRTVKPSRLRAHLALTLEIVPGNAIKL